jgi:hypothetical protein
MGVQSMILRGRNTICFGFGSCRQPVRTAFRDCGIVISNGEDPNARLAIRAIATSFLRRDAVSGHAPDNRRLGL